MPKNPTLSVTEARRTFFQIVKDVVAGRSLPVIVRSHEGDLVLIAREDLEKPIESKPKKMRPEFERALNKTLEEDAEIFEMLADYDASLD